MYIKKCSICEKSMVTRLLNEKTAKNPNFKGFFGNQKYGNSLVTSCKKW